MKGFHIILPSGQRYLAAGKTLPRVGTAIAGFIVEKVARSDVFVRMPASKEEWLTYQAWEDKRKKRNPR